MKFQEHAKAHELLDGKKGVEIGASSHNPFNILGTPNIDLPSVDPIYCDPIWGCLPAKVDIIGRANDLPIPDNSMDFILNSHVLEHIWDPISCLAHWYRKIKVDGYIFMIIPNKHVTFDAPRPITPIKELLRRIGEVNESDGHHSVWDYPSFLELMHYLKYHIIYTEPVDLKCGNGFTVVIQKQI